jgi:hypothetical protein
MAGEQTTTGATRIAEVAAAKAVEASRERSTPGPIAMALISAALGMIIPLIAGAVGYGEIGARLTALEQRMDRSDVASARAMETIGARLDGMAEKLSAIKEDVATIRARGEERRR